MNRPLRHISIRVPWHDTGWDGHVCAAPRLNGACLNLRRIAESRKDEAEEKIAGKTLEEIPHHQWPPCVAERMGFMAPFEYTRFPNHPYNRGPETSHGHFKDTPLRHPPYSAPAVPFYWMLRENLTELAEAHGIDAIKEREPDLGFEAAKTWVQDQKNQQALLDCFRTYVKPERSLCFFYSKQVPFVEDAGARRILIGVGRVLHVTPPQEYDYVTKDLTGRLRSMLWELTVQHSIRPDFKDGFLLPYHAAVRKSEDDPDFDPADIAAFTPADRLPEFSHASQLVTHDGAIASLLSCGSALHRVRQVLPGKWDHCLSWIDAHLGELWRARGPCPGLGPALSAFGMEQGTFVAYALMEKAGENADPWPLVETMFAKPDEHLPPEPAGGVGKTLRAKWERLPDERRALLQLLSRFELSGDQAKLLYVQEERTSSGIDLSDAVIIDNLYTIFEVTRLTNDPVSVWTVDRGVFPPDEIRTKHPLPEPSALDAGTDARRVRALCANVLEDAAADGNTLLPQRQIVLAIRSLEIQPGCAVDSDLMDVAKDDFGGVINEIRMADGAPGRLPCDGLVGEFDGIGRRGNDGPGPARDWRDLAPDSGLRPLSRARSRRPPLSEAGDVRGDRRAGRRRSPRAANSRPPLGRRANAERTWWKSACATRPCTWSAAEKGGFMRTTDGAISSASRSSMLAASCVLTGLSGNSRRRSAARVPATSLSASRAPMISAKTASIPVPADGSSTASSPVRPAAMPAA